MLPKKQIQLLVLEDEAYDLRRIRNTIAPFTEAISIRDVTSNGHHALELISENKNQYDIVIMDFQIAGSLTGETLIRKIKELDPNLQIIVVTKMTINITDFAFAKSLLEAGAMWYCTKYPGDIEDYIYQPTDFILNIFNAYEQRQLKKEQEKSTHKLNQKVSEILESRQIIGKSEAIKTLHQQIRQFADSDTTVLIRGASGTGKELVAANIHYHSRRKFEKFVIINCGTLPADLIESELFGYEKGAFTGALEKKQGLFEIANNGTVFLDEITELPLSAQVKLLRVIQEGEIDKIGRTEQVKVDVRLIAATNKDLEKEVKEKRFREDLYYRINVVPIWTLPLSSHRDDIPILFTHFLDYFCRKMTKEIPEISPEAMQELYRYDWQGNVRELQNVVQRLLLMGIQSVGLAQIKIALGFQQLNHLSKTATDHAFWSVDNIRPLRDVERDIRYQYFCFVRDHSESDADAARLLGLAPPNYHRMCKELGLK